MTSAEAGDDAVLVFDKTPCYAEMGGQVGDQGVAENASTIAQILDTMTIKASVFGHSCHIHEGSVHIGDIFSVSVNAERRAAIARNHSVTHLMHKALRTVCGAHVAQKGSLVTPEITRFDFTHDHPVTAEQIAEVEQLVTRKSSPTSRRRLRKCLSKTRRRRVPPCCSARSTARKSALCRSAPRRSSAAARTLPYG